MTETQKTLSEWVQTRKVIARTQAEWASDKSLLEQQIALLERELSHLRTQLAQVDTNLVGIAEQKKSLAEHEAAYRAALDVAKKNLEQLENRIRAFEPFFPPVLRASLQPMLDKLPTNSARADLPVVPRLITVVTILNEIDKFNNSVTVAEEIRTTGDGNQIVVDVLYAGLSQAWFVSKPGNYAGFGHPSPTGWEWTVRNDIAGAVRKALRIYRNEMPAEVVSLPVVIR